MVQVSTININSFDTMRTISTLLCLCIAALSYGQVVQFNDANFKNALLNHDPVIDLNGDGEIQVSEAEAYTDGIYVSSRGIQDLTGIEAFTNLTRFNAGDNNITEVDLSQNTALELIGLSLNELTTLDLSNNMNLKTLYLDYAGFSEIIFPDNQILEDIRIRYNNLSSIDLSTNNPNLKLLLISFNDFTEFDPSPWPTLTNFENSGNPMNNIDLSGNLDLKTLLLRYNNLTFTDLDLRDFTELEVVAVTQSPNLERLDVSNSPNFKSLFAESSSNLVAINIANGNNANLEYMAVNDNMRLECVQVDPDIIGNIPAHWQYDDESIFSTNCYTRELGIGDNTMLSTSLYPNPASDQVFIQSDAVSLDEISYQVFTLTGELVKEGNGDKIAIQDLATGVYLTNITIGDKSITKKLIKQ